MTRTGQVGADPLRTDRDCPEVKGPFNLAAADAMSGAVERARAVGPAAWEKPAQRPGARSASRSFLLCFVLQVRGPGQSCQLWQ